MGSSAGAVRNEERHADDAPAPGAQGRGRCCAGRRPAWTRPPTELCGEGGLVLRVGLETPTVEGCRTGAAPHVPDLDPRRGRRHPKLLRSDPTVARHSLKSCSRGRQPILTKVGHALATRWPHVGQAWPISVRLRPTSAEVEHSMWSNLVQVGPSSATSGRLGHFSAEVRPKLASCGLSADQLWPTLAALWPMADQIWHRLAQDRASPANLGHISSRTGQFLPNLTRTRSVSIHQLGSNFIIIG